MLDQINRAKGEGEAILTVAEARAQGIEIVGKAANKAGGQDAIGLAVAEKYLEAFANLAKQGNTIIIPANTQDASGMIVQALAIFNNLSNKNATKLSEGHDAD
jgi:regulator of protease activity HflC (stomatin/prohibitin superfamily)